ncbi:MAG TPA: hypothetical protein PKC30_10640 [Saprospiraceae bacterium]|nr:hypothetical protein [Saprospiraceae bacterium]
MKENPADSSPSQHFKAWLERLQQESWQLELLISGLALFGIYAARSVIHDLNQFVDASVTGEFKFIGYLIIFIIQKGWVIFFINMVVHVILRGLWIGTIGLRYVSKEINYDSFHFAERFTYHLKKQVGSYDAYIERLERLCSIIFSFTFLLFLLFTSLMIFVMQLLTIAYLLLRVGEESGFWMNIAMMIVLLYLVLGTIIFIDLITLGGFKRIKEKSISRIYYFIYRFFTYTTLSFLYRPILYNFMDNRYTRKFFYFSIPYILFVLFGSNILENHPQPFVPPKSHLVSTGSGILNYYYDDLRASFLHEFEGSERKLQKKRLPVFTLESYEITKKYSSFFIVIDEKLDQLIESKDLITPYRKKGFSFGWFNRSFIKDPELVMMEKERSRIISGLYRERRELKKLSDTVSNTDEMFKRDSINHVIEFQEAEWKRKINEYSDLKIRRILELYLSFVKIEIDSNQVNYDHCFFSVHTHNSEQGIRCFFPANNLKEGIHTIEFTRLSETSVGDYSENIITLPFIKQ